MRCDIIVVSWNAAQMLAAALRSIHDNANFPYRLIVVDNASDAETVAVLEEAQQTGCYGEMLLIRNTGNLGWIKALNQALAHVDADYVCVMNNDLLTGPDWLRNMIATMERNPAIGLANPSERKAIRENTVADVAEHARELARRHPGEFTEINYCSGFCLLLRREVVERVGKFDEVYGMGYYEDEDYSRRAAMHGFLCVVCHDALVLHYVSRSFGKNEDNKRRVSEHNRAIFEERWGTSKHLLVLAKYPAGEELLKLARHGHTVYVVQNRHVNPRVMSSRHANIKFRGAWAARLFETPYFVFKAFQLRREGRIQSAVIKYSPEGERPERTVAVG